MRTESCLAQFSGPDGHLGSVDVLFVYDDAATLSSIRLGPLTIVGDEARAFAEAIVLSPLQSKGRAPSDAAARIPLLKAPV